MAGEPSSLELQESGWEELRKEARKIERDLDVKLSSYAKLGSRFNSTSSSSSGTRNSHCFSFLFLFYLFSSVFLIGSGAAS